MEKGGIGLENLKKRLEHHYPEKHELRVVQEPALYKVQLTLQL